MALAAVLERFRGSIEQLPPMYSALKRDGVPLYKLARQGKAVERAPRHVRILELEVVSFEPPRLDLRVRCSKGTYIRTLAEDIGAALGTGAHLSGLRRTASGGTPGSRSSLRRENVTRAIPSPVRRGETVKSAASAVMIPDIAAMVTGI